MNTPSKKKTVLSLIGYSAILCLFLLPTLGFCEVSEQVTDINGPLLGLKNILSKVVSRGSPLFWAVMTATSGYGILGIFKGSWKMAITAFIVGLILSNFSYIIDTLLSLKFT